MIVLCASATTPEYIIIIIVSQKKINFKNTKCNYIKGALFSVI